MSGIKKYCGLGLLALLTTAYLTSSCTDNDFSGSVIDAKKQAFSDNFRAAYGNINPNQDWGFGSTSTRAFTRAAEPRANEWAATYKVPEPLSEGQKNRVMKYFQYNQYPGGTTMNISNYFVQQVYKGGYKPLGDGTNGYSTETYLAANQETYITGGSNMDKLTAGTQHEHVYNFNYGEGAWNYNVLNNDQPINNGETHSDQIMLMLNTPTTCMGYWNSNATYGHDDRYRIVSAEEIDRWATAHPELLDEVDAPAQDDWNRDFVGFDFSQVPSDNILVKKNEQYDENWVLVNYELEYATINDGPKTYDYIWDGTRTIKITDENRAQYLYIKDADGYSIPFLDNQRNKYCGYERKKDNSNSSFFFTETAQYVANADNNSSIELTDVPYTRILDNGGTQTENVGPALNLEFINKMIADGYYPIKEQFRTWIAPRDCADGYYSDWIVSLVQAEPKNGGGGDDPETTTRVELLESGRIFCEDLGNVSNKDMDYNDVVFDAWIYVKRTYDSNNNQVGSDVHYRTFIQLLAAGGTIPINVGNLGDVHTIFGAASDKMINTYIVGSSNVREELCVDRALPDELVVRNEFDYFYSQPGGICLKNIPIFIRQGEEVYELQADLGDAPHKFCAPIGTKWVGERIEIGTAYTGFTGWVSNNITPWGTGVENKLYDFSYTPTHGITMDYDPNDDPSINTGSGSGSSTGTSTGTGTGDGSGSGPSFGTITGTTVYSPSTPTTLSSGNGLNIDQSNFTGVAAADIYIYGTGSGSVDVNGAQTEEVTPGATSAPGYNFTNGFGFTRTAENPVVKKCTLGPKQFHGNDIGITGNNFTVYYVSYVDATQQAVSKPEGTTLWSGTKSMDDWGVGQIKIDPYYLDGIGNGTKIRVAGIGFADNVNPDYNGTSWQVQLCNDHSDGWINIETKNIWSEERTGVVTVEFELDDTQAAALLGGKLVVQGINFIAKYVTMDNSGVTTDNGGGTGGGGGDATATINLVTSDVALTGGVAAIVSDQPTAQAYANRIVADTSKLVAKIQVNSNDSWYFKIGPRGNTGDGIMSEKSGYNNNGSEYTYETTINSELLGKILSNVNDSWWSGGMLGAQGNNVVLKELKLTNCAAAE